MRRRFVALAGVLPLLFGASFAAGVEGVFSSSGTTIGRSIRDPTKRLAATVAFADQVALAIAGDHPTIPGPRDALVCPASYAARATTLIGAIANADATKALATSVTRFTQAGWVVDSASRAVRRAPLAATGRLITARTRTGIVVSVTDLVGADLSTMQVTVTVPCPKALPAVPVTTRVVPTTAP